MKRKQIKRHNQRVITQITAWLQERRLRRKLACYRLPIVRVGYKELAAKLNASQIKTSRGNTWTFRSLYRMMQRQGVCLHILDRQQWAITNTLDGGTHAVGRNGHLHSP